MKINYIIFLVSISLLSIFGCIDDHSDEIFAEYYLNLSTDNIEILDYYPDDLTEVPITYDVISQYNKSTIFTIVREIDYNYIFYIDVFYIEDTIIYTYRIIFNTPEAFAYTKNGYISVNDSKIHVIIK